MQNNEPEINHELEKTMDELGEYYYHAFTDMVHGNVYDAYGKPFNKVEERIAFKSVLATVITELLA
jgi:2',3'-cyclic-nucleotide 2'-phosphodiesterase (5'-nucleotidase family)